MGKLQREKTSPGGETNMKKIQLSISVVSSATRREKGLVGVEKKPRGGAANLHP
jgi:hypothetical protein